MRRLFILASVVGGAVSIALLLAQSSSGHSGAVVELTANSANVSGAPEPVRIQIVRWSSSEEREKLLSAWELKTASDKGSAKGAGKLGKGAAKGSAGSGFAKGRGGPAPAAAVVSPESALAKALQESSTVGYVWSSEIAGYALRYAGRIENADGTRRIILITERRIGAVSQKWNPLPPASPNSYEFSVIELRVNAKGEGEGKVSLTGGLTPDAAAQVLTLEDYDKLPVVLRDVKSKAMQP